MAREIIIRFGIRFYYASVINLWITSNREFDAAAGIDGDGNA